MPFPIPFKLIGIALAALAIGLTIYLAFKHYEGLLEENKALSSEVTQLEAANTGLERQIEQLREVQADIRQELEKAIETDSEAREEIQKLEDKITDEEFKSRLKKLEESKKASLILRYIRKHEECLATHFDDFTGSCDFRGKFVEDK